MARFSLQALGRDRPGIVAAVSDALALMGWNLEDSSMSILSGQFAIVLILDARDIADGRVIEAALASVVEDLDLFIAVRPVAEDPQAFEAESMVRIEVHGSDHPGIVAAVAAEIAAVHADICELVSRVVGGEYLMRLRVALPRGVNAAVLRATLDRRADALGVTCDLTEEPTPAP